MDKKTVRLGLLAGLGGTSVAGSALAWAKFYEPSWLEVSRLKLAVSDLPGVSEGWRGYKVAFLSDLHLGPKEPPVRVLWTAVERIIQEQPNLVTFGGDYFTRGKWKNDMSVLLRPLAEARLPMVGVLGNHDYFGRRNDYLRITDGFARTGVTILSNGVYPLEYNGERAWLAGLDDAVKGEPDPTEITRQLPPGERPLILLNHNPDYIKKLPINFAHVTLSGHTHGGQINPALPPFQRSLNWTRFAVTNHRTEFPLGWYNVNGNRLYVGRGLGMSGYQLRFNARPELVMLEFV